MWRSRLRDTFLSNRDEVEAGDEPTITHKTGYDIYRLLPPGVYFFSHFIFQFATVSRSTVRCAWWLFCNFWF